MDRGKRRIIEDEYEEDEPVQIGVSDGSDNSTVGMCLIGKLWTERSYNTIALMETMKKIWNPREGMKCSDLGFNRVAFQFKSLRDMKRVQEMEPWHFNKHILVLKPIAENIQPSAMQFNTTPIWVRIYDLPFTGRNNETLKQIGSRIGEVLEIDKEMSDGMTRSVRLKIEIQLDKPLKRGIKVRIGKADPVGVTISYERLPSFCYCCGKLGHTHKDCDKTEEADIAEDDMPYGDFMRASPLKLSRVMGENRDTTRDKFRKSLFEGDTGVRTLKEDKDKYNSKKNVDKVPYETVAELMSDLEKVKFEGKEAEEKPNLHQKPDILDPRKENPRDSTPRNYLSKQNSLHPTTKTLTPIPPHSSKSPMAKENITPSVSLPETQLKPSPEPNLLLKPQSHQPSIPPPPPTRADPNKTHIYEPQHPTLTPISSLRAMVQQCHTTPHQPTYNNHTKPTKPPLKADIKPTATNLEIDKGEKKLTGRWKRLPLITPKVEGECVKSGKRASDSGSITPNFEASIKKSKRGYSSTTATTAEADIQPRRSS